MNLNRLLSVRRGRARLVRVLALTLVGLLLTTGVAFQPDGGRAGAAAVPQSTKLGTPKPKEQALAAQQTQPAQKDGVKAFTVGNVEPNSTSCPVKTPISPGETRNGTLASGDCTLNDGTFYDEYTFNANAGQQVAITMSSNTLDTYLILLKPGETAPSSTTIFNDDDCVPGAACTTTNSRIPAGRGFITLPTTGQYSILANLFAAVDRPTTGDYTLTLTFGGSNGTVCPPNPTIINNGQTVNGILDNNDCTLQDNTRFDAFSFTANAGQQVSITMTSTTVNGTPGLQDPYLLLLAPDGTDIAEDDNGGGGNTARIPPGGGVAVLPQTGTYTIYANSTITGQTGGYALTLNISSALCPSTAISSGTVNGTLGAGDCLLPADGSLVDLYTFSGTQGQQITITMAAAAGSGVDPYLFLLSPTGVELTFNDNGGGGTVARIPPTTGTFPLPASGTYTIIANSAQRGQTGAYTLTLTGAGTPTCTYTLSQTNASFAAVGGSATLNFNTQAGCAAPTVTSNASWLTVGAVTVGANGAGTINYTVAPNIGISRTGVLTVAGQAFTVTQSANCTYTLTQSNVSIAAGGGSFSVGVISQAGCPLVPADVTSNAPWLTVGAVTMDATGNGTVNYTVAANTVNASRTATLTIAGQAVTITQAPVGAPVVQFSATAYTVAENNVAESNTNAAKITVIRSSGDPSVAITVEYSTIDDQASIPCDPTARDQNGNLFPRGTAFARCDYATTIDSLTLAPGEMSKDFFIPLINDVHVEGNETFQVRLDASTGAALGTPATATVTITDNDTGTATTNPINQTPFFVRQHYLDFLAREPEATEPWTRVLNNCSDVNNNPACDRLTVSGSFFGSPEFLTKGVYVIVFYRVAFNRLPSYAEFARDLRSVTGATAAETNAKRAAFAVSFTQRQEFTTAYPANMTNAAYVSALLGRYGLSVITTPDPANPDAPGRVTLTSGDLTARLDAGSLTRAQVLRAIVDSDEVKLQREATNAFVASQYYGYLRRAPDTGGFNGWLNYLNSHPGDFRTMVNGFLNSTEYRLRFGPNTLQ